MSEADIRKVVNATIDAMLKRNMIRFNDNMILSAAGNILTRYYNGDITDAAIDDALNILKDYTYSEVLRMYYHDHMTLEEIAERYNVDVSTIRRNKKKLCIKFYNLLPEGVLLSDI